MDTVERIAAAVLYEGYLLWPYRRSARKNQRRWTFGGVYPRAYSEAGHADDPWLMQTQCLVLGDAPVLDLSVRFLQVVERQVARRNADGGLEPVDELQVGGERYLTWEEAAERTIAAGDLRLSELATPRRLAISTPAGQDETPIVAPDGTVAGAFLRSWRAIDGAVEVSAEALAPGLTRLTVRIVNSTPWSGGSREEALRQAMASTHTILRVREGSFVSLLDPPPELAQAAAACRNIKTWPVLAGAAGDRSTMLSSPIILYDYPQVAPESPGDLFDGTEIDELLALNILALTDEEKAEMRASDPRAREILERTEALSPANLGNLHGAIREFRMLGDEADLLSPLFGLEMPPPATVMVNGTAIGKGSRVRLRPRAGADIFDLALAGRVAVVAEIEQDFEERVHLAVTIEDDPGRDLGEARMIGHRFYFSTDEVEPLGSEDGR